MKALVTGGAGFIGTALAKQLIDLNIETHIIDLEEKIAIASTLHSANYHACDIADYSTLASIPSQQFDYIFHLASQTSGLISHENPTLDVDTNVKGTLNICRLASEAGIPKIVFTSSMAVYGNYDTPISEDFELKPLSNYGVSKLAAEAYIKLFRSRGVEHTIFRLFNVYGPGQDLSNMKQGMLSIYIAQLIKNNRIDVTGSFERFRDFVYIDDVVKALLLGLEPESNSETYNVGTGVKTTVRTLIDSIIKQADAANIPVTNVGGIVGDQFGTVSDSSKLKSAGWRTEVELDKGLTGTIREARQLLL